MSSNFHVIKVLFIAKLDVLCQLNGPRVVNGDSGATHVVLPRVRAALSASAGGLLASKGASDFRSVSWDVYVDDTTVRAVRANPLKLLFFV